MGKKTYLRLANGLLFEGESFGAEGRVNGELVFTTSMVGYLETLTDARYHGQMVVQTFPLIGNYGVIPADVEGKTPRLSAYIVREHCQEPSNFRSEGVLDDFLKLKGIIGLSGIDTRELTRVIRSAGTMAARITDDPEDFEGLDQFSIKNAVKAVSSGSNALVKTKGAKFTVGLWDFGECGNVAQALAMRGCNIKWIPCDTQADEIVKFGFDGLVLSAGPGDPAENKKIAGEIKKVLKADIPTMGIGLGHQLLAMAHGAKTYKLPCGHRGSNQPVRELGTLRVYMTSQNHGYAVDASSLPKTASLWLENANDGTCEGIEYLKTRAFSCQFFPDANQKGASTAHLYDRFIGLMGGELHAAE